MGPRPAADCGLTAEAASARCGYVVRTAVESSPASPPPHGKAAWCLGGQIDRAPFWLPALGG